MGSNHSKNGSPGTPGSPETTIDSAVIRFCGDSGDGMQLAGGQFTNTSALFGNDFATFPDFPAEIRAPRGTTYGVSGFQVQFASDDVYTPGDQVNALVAMNPAGFKMNIEDVEPGGLVIVNEDEFSKPNLKKCGYPDGYNPLTDENLTTSYNIIPIPMSRLTRESLAKSGMGTKVVDRARNMYALGIVYWLYERPIETTVRYLEKVFSEKKGQPEIAELNVQALKAGYYFGETAEMIPRYRVPPAVHEPGTYRRVSGNEALVLGLVTAARKAEKEILYASYPITPASTIIHSMAYLKQFGVKTFQAEDEIAAVCSALGASFAGNIGITGTSGPGMALKAEAISLAVMLELPLVVIDVQRAGPSTGMPTKTEQADLLQAFYGRPSESPCIVLAAQSPADCFDIAFESVRLAVAAMCPVIVLSDAYLASGAEPWRIPNVDEIAPIKIVHPQADQLNGEEFMPYRRDPETLARPWAIPGAPGLEHRVGGLEKAEGTGDVSYDPDNHHRMMKIRNEKVQRVARLIPPLKVRGPETGDVLVLGWGGTYGSIVTAVDRLRAEGCSVSSAHLRYLNPFPSNLGDVLARFERVVVPEINLGQLSMLIRAKYRIDTVDINILRGRPLVTSTLVETIRGIIECAATV